MIKKLTSGLVLSCITLIHCNVALSEIIEDEVAKQSFAGQNHTKPVYQKPIIEDQVAKEAFENKNFSKPLYCSVIITDDTAPVKTQNRPIVKIEPIEDELLVNDQKLKTCDKTRPAVYYKLIDEKNSIVKIKISPKTYISNQNNLKVGDRIDLRISQDIYRDGVLFIKKDTPVNAYIELISNADRFGDPQEIELSRLITKDTNNNPIEIEGVIRKEGANRAKWVKPLYYIGTCAPFGAPLMLVFFIKGGKTKLKPTEEFEFYYE